MNLLNALHALLGQHQQQQARPQPGADFTYNPNPRINIPNSSHSLQQVLSANGRFTPQQAHSVGEAANYVNPQQFPQLNQGGLFNPGFTPLQMSNLSYRQGLQPTAELRGQPSPQATFNPQNPYGLY